MYEMLTSRSPFAALNALQCIEKIRQLEYTIPPLFPPVAKDLVKRLLVIFPDSTDFINKLLLTLPNYIQDSKSKNTTRC